MTKKDKKRGKQTGKSEGDNLLKKLSRTELLELLLEQTRRADELERQLTRALQERDDNDSKLRDVLKLSRFAIDMIDKEAGQRAHDIIEKQIAEGKLVRTGDIESKLAEYETEYKSAKAAKTQRTEVPKPIVKPAPAAAAPRTEVPKPAAKPAVKPAVKPVQKPAIKPSTDSTSAFIDENGFIDVAKIFGAK